MTAPADRLPLRFHLQRDTDISGVSGTGRVADGVLWADGTASVRWLGDRPSIVFWDHGVADAEYIHGHGGSTRIVWDDEPPATPKPARLQVAAPPWPTETEWIVESQWRDGKWRNYGRARDDRAEALEEYEDVVQRCGAKHAYRLVRAVTTCTTEAEHTLEPQP